MKLLGLLAAISVFCLGPSAYGGSAHEVQNPMAMSINGINVPMSNEVALPAGQTCVPYKAFYGRKGVRRVMLPSSVNTISKRAFALCSDLESIDLPEGITVIQPSTFESCSSLKKVGMPFSLTRIERSAFMNCRSLESINFPVGLTKIGAYAFACCVALRRAEIPDGVLQIQNGAFHSCTNLQSVRLPCGLQILSEHMFAECVSLKSVEQSSALTNIQACAFANCTSISEMSIPNGVKEIAWQAFWQCTSLQSVSLPASLVRMEGAFEKCSSLKNVDIAPDNSVYASVNGHVTTKDGKSLVMAIPGKALSVPSGIIDVRPDAFANCTETIEITIAATITNISEYAFNYADRLERILVENGCAAYRSINGALYSSKGKCIVRCPGSVRQMEIAAGTESIGRSAFDKCARLKTVSLPTTIRTIGEFAFYGCRELNHVSIPASVVSIGRDAFADCPRLRRVRFYGDAPKISGDVFRWGDTNLVIEVQHGSHGWCEGEWQKYNVQFQVLDSQYFCTPQLQF